MNIETKKYLAKPNEPFSLKDFETTYKGELTKELGKKELERLKNQLNTYQQKLYATGKHAVLIIFQAMDAAGKDSTIEHVMTGLNPQGFQIYNFKTPSKQEYEHDFLWRHHQAIPEKGRIGIHNRSHYENVLVCKVHPSYVLNENLPDYDTVEKLDEKFWISRYQRIIEFEKQLTDSGVVLIKFFLNVSKDEQKQRFLDRINDPAKNWKFEVGDMKERACWKDYQKAYRGAIAETSTKNAPWYVIPADKKWYARLVVAQVIADTFEGLNLEFPTLEDDKLQQLEEIKKQLMSE